MAGERVHTEVGGRSLTLSNLTKPLFADGFTKGEVIDYYLRAAPVLLPHLERRCLTRVRFPEGTSGQGFFEKNPPSGAPDWLTTQIVVGSTGEVSYVVADSDAALVYLANLAALELHTPQWQIPDPGVPVVLDGPDEPLADRLMVDLDPGEGVTMQQTALAALTVAAHLASDALVTLVKTSGNKGLQLVAPISPTPCSTVFAFAKRLAAELATAQPALFTDTMAIVARKGLVFVDYSQNLAARNTVTPYSLRGLASPGVSTPVTWDEVADAANGTPLRFTPADVLDRIARHGDLWAEALAPSSQALRAQP